MTATYYRHAGDLATELDRLRSIVRTHIPDYVGAVDDMETALELVREAIAVLNHDGGRNAN